MKSLIALIACLLFAVQVSAASATNEPRQVASQWYKAFAHRDAELLEKILAPTWVDIPSPPDAPHGPEAAKALMAMLVGAFPDFDIRIEDIIQDGNKVVVRSTITGTQQQAFVGLPGNRAIHEDPSRRYPRNRGRQDRSHLAHRGLDDRSAGIGPPVSIGNRDDNDKRDKRQAEWSPVHEVRGVRRYRLGLRNA
jgi:predicted ester cyclase